MKGFSLLRPPQPPIEAVLTTLLNDLHALPNDVALVSTTTTSSTRRDIHDGIVFLLDHLPPQIHLVIAGRADPAFPLTRMRARGLLVEIRAANLRFTPDEAAAYLNEVAALGLDVAALEERTKGGSPRTFTQAVYATLPGSSRLPERYTGTASRAAFVRPRSDAATS